MKTKVRSVMRSVAALLVCAAAGLSAQAGTVTYYHNDLAGSPVVATNASGAVVWRESYRPYGERLVNSAAASGNKIWFTSRRQDPETGLVYMGARYYDPLAGRFISMDPKAFDEANEHSFNRYAYANDNPYKYADPDGKSPLILWALGGYGAGVVADAVSQYAAWSSVDWKLALSSSAAMSGAQAGLMSPAGGASVGLTIERASAEAISEGATATAGKSVLGHYPNYINSAKNIGARYFNVPPAIWESMTSAEQWAANARFLDRLIARGDTVVLSSPAAEARAGSAFARELEYLTGKGYTLSKDGMRMLPPVR